MAQSNTATEIRRARDAEIYELAAKGIPLPSIAGEFGMSTYAIRRILQEAGVKAASGHGFIAKSSEEERTKIVEEYLAGKPIAQLVVDHSKSGLSVNALYMLLARKGVAIGERKRGPRVDEALKARHAKAVQMYLGGSTLTEITVATGLAATQIYVVLRQEGVSTRREEYWKTIQAKLARDAIEEQVAEEASNDCPTQSDAQEQA